MLKDVIKYCDVFNTFRKPWCEKKTILIQIHMRFWGNMIHLDIFSQTYNCLWSHDNCCFGESFFELQQLGQGDRSQPGIAPAHKHHVPLAELGRLLLMKRTYFKVICEMFLGTDGLGLRKGNSSREPFICYEYVIFTKPTCIIQSYWWLSISLQEIKRRNLYMSFCMIFNWLQTFIWIKYGNTFT